VFEIVGEGEQRVAIIENTTQLGDELARDVGRQARRHRQAPAHLLELVALHCRTLAPASEHMFV
jgi:hypothetical protein